VTENPVKAALGNPDLLLKFDEEKEMEEDEFAGFTYEARKSVLGGRQEDDAALCFE
jgi:hypothetical protein